MILFLDTAEPIPLSRLYANEVADQFYFICVVKKNIPVIQMILGEGPKTIEMAWKRKESNIPVLLINESNKAAGFKSAGDQFDMDEQRFVLNNI